MATLPNIPVNSAITVGVLAVTGLVAYQQTLRTKIESQIHANYRAFKAIDAGLEPEKSEKPKLVVREA
jgi:hypothetical protein